MAISLQIDGKEAALKKGSSTENVQTRNADYQG